MSYHQTNAAEGAIDDTDMDDLGMKSAPHFSNPMGFINRQCNLEKVLSCNTIGESMNILRSTKWSILCSGGFR